MNRYFRQFPLVSYDGTPAVDITRRAVLVNSVKKNPMLYYPFQVTDGDRADNIADRYYEDQYMDWLLRLANDVIDPYYGWYMGQEDFEEVLKAKFGSVEEAHRRVAFYRNNWYEDPQEISVSRFNDLTPDEIKYWEPQYGVSSSVLSYKRRAVDWVVDTNQVLKYTVANSGTFTDGEKVTVTLVSGNTGSAFVALANSTVMSLKHTVGLTIPTDEQPLSGNSFVLGQTSGATANVTAVSVVSNCIPSAELVYWSAVTEYQLAEERNAANQNIRILDRRFASQAVDEVKRILGG